MKSYFTERDIRIFSSIGSVVVSLGLIITYVIDLFSDRSNSVVYVSKLTHTPLAQDLISFNMENPNLSIYLLGAVLIGATLFMFAYTTRRTLYPQGVYLQPIIFTSLSLAICSMSQYPILTALTLFCAVAATAEICSVNHTSYTTSIYSDTPTSVKSPTSRFFVGALYLGILSLLQPSAVVLVLIFPIAVFCFDRYIYEMVVPIVAFFIPMAIEIYIRWWLYDANVDVLMSRYQSLLLPSGDLFLSWGEYMTLIQSSYPTTFLVILSLLLSGLGLARTLNYSITARARQRFVFSVVLFIVGLIMTTLASFSIEVLLIIAAPVAILITSALINLRIIGSVLIYGVYMLLTLFALFN